MSRQKFDLRRTARFVVAAAVLVIAAPLIAHSNVSLKNGNFFIGYTDIVYPGGFEPKIERVYNSKTSYSGMFGPGWGNEYEVFLTVSADGSVVVHEYGGGAENRFNPVSFKAGELEKAIDAITVAASKANFIPTSPDGIRRYKVDLRNAEFRNKEWEKLRAGGRIAERKLPVGAQLHSNKFSYQFITKLSDGYQRNFDNGRIERFSETAEDGRARLLRIADKNKNFIELSYGKDGHLAKMQDNFNRKMFFSWNNLGLLEKIDGENGKKSEYKYNDIGELKWSKDVDGNAYNYKYDKRHNLTEIGYSDKTKMVMTYFGPDKHDNIKSVTDRDGTVTDYAYDTDNADKNHYWVSASVKGKDGKEISTSKYEYSIKFKADGEEWTYKLVTTLDGERTETIYNECCGAPLVIKRGTEETSFEYDTKGHVTKKITPTEETDLSYDPKASKVSKVVRYSKLDRKQSGWSTFQYDDSGNLVFAKNSEGKGVKLFYDNHGRIMSLLDQSHRRINFKYDPQTSKPIEITDPQLGTITVNYTNSGEIKKVESTAGRKIALQVTSAFQNLLDIIRPAGVSLSF